MYMSDTCPAGRLAGCPFCVAKTNVGHYMQTFHPDVLIPAIIIIIMVLFL